jgi:Hypoxia induced protein conserved region
MNEFTSPNTFPALLQFLAQSRKRLECRTSTVALEDVHLRWRMRINAAAEEYRNAANQPFPLGWAPTAALCALRHTVFAAGGARNTRATIQRGAGKNCSGRRTMDLFVVVIIAAMFFTVATVFLGVLTMSSGGSTNKTLSTPLMWTRVGFQALTILLLFAAIRLR